MELLANQNVQGLADLLQQSLDAEKERMSQF